jgi:hypothetical protein
MAPPDAAPVIEANTSARSLFAALVSQHAHVASFDLSQRQLTQRSLKFRGVKSGDNGARIS